MYWRRPRAQVFIRTQALSWLPQMSSLLPMTLSATSLCTDIIPELTAQCTSSVSLVSTSHPLASPTSSHLLLPVLVNDAHMFTFTPPSLSSSFPVQLAMNEPKFRPLVSASLSSPSILLDLEFHELPEPKPKCSVSPSSSSATPLLYRLTHQPSFRHLANSHLFCWLDLLFSMTKS